MHIACSLPAFPLYSKPYPKPSSSVCTALMAPIFVFLLALLAASSVRASHHHYRIDPDAPAAVSKLLHSYNLPAGLFPTSVVSSLSHDEDDGSFQMKLDRSCYAKFEDELLWYGEEIKGKMRAGGVGDLSGIEAREYLVWLPVKGIHVDDPETGFVYLELGVGPSYRKLSASSFHYPPACSSEEALRAFFPL